jgi:hypothetical protein
MKWIYDDGGRQEAGFKGSTGDCACRAIAIATGQAYRTVYDGLNSTSKSEKPRKGRRRSSSRTGVTRKTCAAYLAAEGWAWMPTMQIGSGCRVHMRRDELPPGKLIVRVSGHFAAVVDGVVYDTHDPSRDGSRCVYGYWQQS